MTWPLHTFISAPDAWCAANSPPIDGLLSAGLLAALGIVVAPFFARIPAHQPGTDPFKNARDQGFRKASRIMAPFALGTAGVAVTVYTKVYVDSGGKSCADLTASEVVDGRLMWALGAAIMATFVLLVAISICRAIFDNKQG